LVRRAVREGKPVSYEVLKDYPDLISRYATATESPILQPTREVVAEKRWQQIKRYMHTIDEIKQIAERRGIVHLYHGCPTEFADLLVKYGPKVPYAVEDTGRYVAKVYGLTWMEFRRYVYRSHEYVSRLSTAPAAIACRWAWSFPLGEVLSDINAMARMYIRFKEIARERGISLDDAYDDLYNEAVELAKARGYYATSDSAPDILGLPDKLALKDQTGSLVQIDVDARALPKYAVHDAGLHMKHLASKEMSEQEVFLAWNHHYRDVKIAPGNVGPRRIVIRGMERWEQDMIEDIIRREIAEIL